MEKSLTHILLKYTDGTTKLVERGFCLRIEGEDLYADFLDISDRDLKPMLTALITSLQILEAEVKNRS